jgi:cytoskeletal protein CcmA (bactofilin family)
MTWWLLFTLTALAILWPLLPAISEWARPTDTQPLQIDSCNTLDPPCLARTFALRLGTALASGETQLGSSALAHAPARGHWPLDAKEQNTGTSARVWHAPGDAHLPAGLHFLAEVAAQGALHTSGGIYRALWAGQLLQLTPGTQVLRWAHGTRVEVGQGCHLVGRVSAQECIRVGGGTSFTLLHAPMVRFLPEAAQRLIEPTIVARMGLPQAVAWDAATSRGVCESALQVAPHTTWRGDLVCRNTLLLGQGCNAHGSLKAQGDLVLGADTSVTGSVVAQGRLTLKAGCKVRGLVVSETAIVIECACVIGTPEHPATVTAPRIQVAPGVLVFGTLWATAHGLTEDLSMALSPAHTEASHSFGQLANEALA